jgi:ADP-ribose pyrophosphatase YjhB (NUDIX family)
VGGETAVPLSPYIRAMRAKIGHSLLMLQSVTVILFDQEDRMLLAKDGESGLWMTIGGAVEPDEVPADAAVREFWEETGLMIEPVRLLGVFGGPQFCITYPNGDVVCYVVTLFEGQLLNGEACPDGYEAVALRFISRDEVAELPMAVWTKELVLHAFQQYEVPYFAPPTWKPTQSHDGGDIRSEPN